MCREQEREDLARLQEFADAIMDPTASRQRLHAALDGLAARNAWPVAAAIADEIAPSDAVRVLCLEWWIACGDGLRGAILDDTVLVALLRALLPPYAGPARQLYRGEFAANANVGLWGISWTASLACARRFADSARAEASLSDARISAIVRSLARGGCDR
jgi:hypothetical protein